MCSPSASPVKEGDSSGHRGPSGGVHLVLVSLDGGDGVRPGPVDGDRGRVQVGAAGRRGDRDHRRGRVQLQVHRRGGEVAGTVRGLDLDEMTAVGLAGEGAGERHRAGGPGAVVDAVLVPLHPGGGVGAVPGDDHGGDQGMLRRGQDVDRRRSHVDLERYGRQLQVVDRVERPYVDGVRSVGDTGEHVGHVHRLGRPCPAVDAVLIAGNAGSGVGRGPGGGDRGRAQVCCRWPVR